MNWRIEMKRVSMFTVLIGFACVTVAVLAQTNPPSPQIVGSQVAAYWTSNQLNAAESYITNLYANYPNYVPAILAKAAYEEIWKNNPSNFLSGVRRVYEANVGNNYFKALISAEKNQSELLLKTYYEEGTSHNTLTNAADPQAVRTQVIKWPYTDLMTNAPNATLSPP
jgi:hypothetical protein